MAKLTGAAARQFIDKPRPAAAVLFFGTNRSLIGEAAGSYQKFVLGRAAGDPYAVTRLTEEDLKRDRACLGDALGAQSLLGDARLVRLRLEGEAAAPIVVEELAQIEAGAAANVLLVEAPGASATGALVKAFEKAAKAYCLGLYEESAADLDGFLQDLVSAEQLALTPEAFDQMRATLPNDRTAIRREVEKLALYAHDLGRPVAGADLDALLGDAAALALDQAIDQALAGEGAVAVETLERVAGSAPVSILKAMERRLLRMAEVRTRMDHGGAGAADAMKALKPPAFFREKDSMLAALRFWRAGMISAALDRAWACEAACKRAGAPADILVARCFGEIARVARSGRP